jgi:hypothetical protein
MAQATLVGLCSTNVVTILQPSSTIECLPIGSSYSITDIQTVLPAISGTSSFAIAFPEAATYSIIGNLALTTTGTGYIQIQLGSGPVIKQTATQYMNIPINFIIKDTMTALIQIAVSGVAISSGSLQYQYIQYLVGI